MHPDGFDATQRPDGATACPDPGPPAAPPAVVPHRLARPNWTLVVTIVACVLGVALWVFGLYVYATHDEVDWIDRPEVMTAAEHGCQAVVAEIRLPRQDRLRRIDAGNAAIRRLVEEVSALGADVLDDDLPARDWLDDWRALASARAAYADALASGDAKPFAVPRAEDGHPITERMVHAAPECEDAARLAANP